MYKLFAFIFVSLSTSISLQAQTIKGKVIDTNGEPIEFATAAVILDGAVVKAELPSVELRGNALITNVAGSVLEHQGNAEDVLEQIPGIIRMNESLEVIGRGAPQFYINGRKVNNNDELRNLTSEEIRGVELISNPGPPMVGKPGLS